MAWAAIVAKLQAGLSVTFRPTGNSMAPRIKSGQEVTILPMGVQEPEVGMVVLAKVRGSYYLHLVTARRRRQHDYVQISNNHGFVNGWTTIDRVYGYVDEGGDASVGARRKPPPKAPARTQRLGNPPPSKVRYPPGTPSGVVDDRSPLRVPGKGLRGPI